MAMIREVVDQYQYVAMDTEFPGVVARPVHSTKVNEYQYQTLRCNVDMLKLIQLGLTFCDEDGNLPSFDGKYMVIWQFNFREFDVENDMYAEDSIELLKESGIDFDELMQRGIEVHRFGELLMTSGVVLNDEIRWLTFHYKEEDFFEILRIFFPRIYDIKYMMKFCDSLHGGLNKLAEMLEKLLDKIYSFLCHQVFVI
eukprot:jgi/Pico_ML_1/53861/g4331.t1